MKRFLKVLWREWVRPLGLMFLIVAPVKSAIIDWNWVPTGSMKPTILEGELVLVNKLAYGLRVPFTTHYLVRWSEPARGEVAVFLSPTDRTRLVKRIIGTPGDSIALQNDVLTINGLRQSYTRINSQPFVRSIFEDHSPIIAVEHLDSGDHWVLALPHRSALRTFGPQRVPDGEYFMMGDSRDNSNDSRFIGTASRDVILGRALGVIVSFDTSRYLLPRPSRFFHSFTLGKSDRS